MRSAGSDGPSIPAIASWSTDGTPGHADRDAQAVLAEERDVRLVVGRQLELPEPDRVEAGCGVRLDVLREGGADRRDLREREDHERPGILASSRCVIGGFVSSFATR